MSGCRDLLLEARGEEEEDPVGSVVAGEGPTAYLLDLFFRWDFSDPINVCLGYPVLRYPTDCVFNRASPSSQWVLQLIRDEAQVLNF